MGKAVKTERQHLAVLFAGNLHGLRMEKGISMKQAAADLGVARSTWCQWEQGTRLPPAFFLELLSEYFDVPSCRFLALHPAACFPPDVGIRSRRVNY